MQQLDFWIRKRAIQSPNKIALIQIESGEAWTYDELMKHAYWWSEQFTERKLKKGDRVAALMENSIESFAILFACRLNELIYVPLNTRLTKDELKAIVADCTPSLLVADTMHVERALSLDSMPVVLGQSEMLSSSPSIDWSDEQQLEWLIIYTGGTTGKPKGVVLSYEAVTVNAINTTISWGLNNQDCTLNYMPLFHTGGINALALPILLAGGTVVIGKKFDPERAIRAINEYKTTISLFVPTMYQLMTQTAYFQESSFPTVKVFLSGGAPCPKPIYERFHEKGLQFKEGYGLTEAGPNNFFIDENIVKTKKGAVGKSMLFNEVRVVDSNGDPCGVDEVGELWIKGSHMFSYYWNNEQETSVTFQDGWLKTGDLARFDEDGDYFIVGRKKEMIITGGENVYPQEIEQCLVLHPAVKEATVVGIPDEKWGECIVAFVVLDYGQMTSGELVGRSAEAGGVQVGRSADAGGMLFEQGEAEVGSGLFEQGEAEVGSGLFEQGEAEVGSGLFEQGEAEVGSGLCEHGEAEVGSGLFEQGEAEVGSGLHGHGVSGMGSGLHEHATSEEGSELLQHGQLEANRSALPDVSELLKTYCKERLANYKVPKHFQIVEELPKTVVGKIDKKQLQQMALN